MKHPLGAKIIFSYGMTKCGSTLAFELARTGLERAGYSQPLLKLPGLRKEAMINFAAHLTESELDGIWYKVQEIGHPIVIKTHTRPDLPVIDFINSGHGLIQATYRDPRDMALSILDHGERNRKMNRTSFTEITTLSQAVTNIEHQLDSLAQWLIRPNCLPLYFDDLAFNTVITCRRILAQLHLEISPHKIATHVKNHRFTQQNKGIRNRYKKEMSTADSIYFREHFAPLYTTLIHKRKSIPYTGEPILPDGTNLVNDS